jgi:hypothetical protein
MEENADASCAVRHSPWQLEDELIAALDWPLNLLGNARNTLYTLLTPTCQMRCPAGAKS